MRHGKVKNLPSNPREIYDEALKVSFNFWIDEKGTVDHPDVWRRERSKLSYEEAFDLIQDYKPHWIVSFRNVSFLSPQDDFWEFGGCNIGDNKYGEVFIWIQVTPEEAFKLFDKYNLEIEYY